MPEPSQEASKGEADKLLRAIEAKFAAILKQIEIMRRTGTQTPPVMAKIAKLARELAAIADGLDDSIPAKGPHRARVAALRKTAVRVVARYRRALAPGGTEPASETDEAKQKIVARIKPLAPRMELGGQITVIGEVVKVATKRWKRVHAAER